MRGALSSYLKGFVTFAYETGSVFNRYNIVSKEDLKLAAQKQESYLKSQIGTISGTVHQLYTNKDVVNYR